MFQVNTCNQDESCKHTFRFQTAEAESCTSVSVIVPIVNDISSLSAAIDSILTQSITVSEIIVVDTSISGWAKDVVEGYPRVQYIRQEPSSFSVVCNIGLQASSGDYLLFLSPQSSLLPNAIAIGISCLEVSPSCGFAVGMGKSIASNGLPLQSAIDLQEQVLGVPIYRSLLGGTNLLPSARVIFRREVFEQIGGFDESLGCAAEYDLHLRAAADFVGCCHNQMVVEYREGNDVPIQVASSYSQSLRNYLSVLQKQRMHVKRNQSDRKAYEVGRRYWYGIYKSALIHEIVSCYRQWQFITAAKALYLMLHFGF
jgi:hypothetical protein